MAIVQQIITGKAKNAVHATQYINTIIDAPVCSQTMRNTLKEANLKAMVKKKSHSFLVAQEKEVSFCFQA